MIDSMETRLPGTNLVPCQQVATFNTLLKDNRSISLPRARIDGILLCAKYNVTDDGISAGESIFGAIDRISIGSPGQYALIFESDEMIPLVTLLGGFATGLYADGTPTTATDEYAYAYFKGPFTFLGNEAPEIYIEMGAITDEWGGASAFSAEISALVILSDIQAGPGYVVERQYKPTSTRHDLDKLGTGLVEDFIIVQADITNTSRVDITYGDGRTDLTVARPYELNKLFCAHGHASNTTTLLFENVDIPAGARRRISITNSTTDTALAFFKNIVSI